MLSKYGADSNITNNEYETPMVLASENNDRDIIELLSSDTQNVIKKHIVMDTYACSADVSDLADEILSGGQSPLPQYEFDAEEQIQTHLDTKQYLNKHQMEKSDYQTFEQQLDENEK